MKTSEATTQPLLTTPVNQKFSLEGAIGRRIDAVIENWLLSAPIANPGMLEMFRRRDRKPFVGQVPWIGEFAGKYLTHAVQILNLTEDTRLRDQISWFVDELVSLQDADGYLGPWPGDCRLRGQTEWGKLWDSWGHYHIMIGLLLWHRRTQDVKALSCVQAIADMLCRRFLGTDETLLSTESEEMNMSPIHALLLLYKIDANPKYLALARQIEREWEMPPAGDYIRQALAGREFWETPKPRWESLHPIMALPELYFLTGDDRYRAAVEHLWWSMARGDRHNNGGFSSGEQATGNPYDSGAIETCCTVAWMTLSADMLRLTGNSIVADEIELSLLNSGLGLISPSGRWVTYNTPMDGVKEASAHSIVFQARSGIPELNCCSVNGPRVLGLVGEWALLARENGLALSYYGPCVLSCSLPCGADVTLTQSTEYPIEPSVDIEIGLSDEASFPLWLRIPAWSSNTMVRVNGAAVEKVASGLYLCIDREWRTGDRITTLFDFTPRAWVRPSRSAETDAVHLASIYRGPILLAFDPRFNDVDAPGVPTIDVTGLRLDRSSVSTWLQPQLLVEAVCEDGTVIHLCDFASAGWGGEAYRSWLPIRLDEPATCEFTQSNPMRTVSVAHRR